MKTLTFHITPDHPDFKTARFQSQEARRLRNGINVLARSAYFHYLDNDADLSIAAEFGMDTVIRKGEFKTSKNKLVALVNLVKSVQGIELQSKVSQNVARELADSWSSFYELRKMGMKANIPGYTKAYAVASFNPQAVSTRMIKKGIILPADWKTGFQVPPHINPSHIRGAKIVPVHDQLFSLKVLYQAPIESDKYTPVPGLVAGVDPGINNLLTIGFSNLSEGLIVDGRPLKTLNSYYNFATSQLKSKLDIEASNLFEKAKKGLSEEEAKQLRKPVLKSARLGHLWEKRRRRINHYYTTMTNAVLENLLSVGVESVVIGYNSGIKQRVNMGKRNNRKFVQIPIKQILDNLAYKCEQAGIRVVWTEESYTSKASFMDMDVLPVHGTPGPRTFSGRRTMRGLYRTKDGRLINADLNGALNIIRKGELQLNESGGIIFTDVATRSVVPSLRRLHPQGC